MTLAEQLAAAGFNEESEDTTFESSEIEFENTTGIAKKYLSLTIEELVKIKGGVTNLKQWTGILKDLKAIEKIEQERLERRNELVEKDFMISQIKKYVDLFVSNEFDAAETQQAIITSYYKSDPDTAELKTKDLRVKTVTKNSREAIKSINQSLKSLKKKYDSENADA